MHTLKQALRPSRIVHSVASALTFGSVGKPFLSELTRMVRAAHPFSGFGPARATVSSQKPDLGGVSPAKQRFASLQLQDGEMRIDFLASDARFIAHGSDAKKELKLLDRTAQLYVGRIADRADGDQYDPSADLQDLTALRGAFSDFLTRAAQQPWGKNIPKSTTEAIRACMSAMETQQQALARIAFE